MMGLLSIVFLAALVGIIKPYIGTLGRKHFAGIAAAALVGMMIVVPKTDSPDASQAALSLADDKGTAGKLGNAAATEAAGKWMYQTQKDEMRGTTSRYADLGSENEVDLDFPYGVQRGRLTVRQNPEQGLDVMFSVESGQILCNSFSDSRISVKFDDGPIQSMGCTDSSDGSNDVAFFTNEGRMLSGLKKAKRTVIEAKFFQKGRQQFVFETAGLEWK